MKQLTNHVSAYFPQLLQLETFTYMYTCSSSFSNLDTGPAKNPNKALSKIPPQAVSFDFGQQQQASK